MPRRLLYDTHMVTIEVGAEKEHFVVHQSFLCARSPYFVKALSGSFQEAITRFIRLPDISPVLFRIFVAWLYHGDIGYVPRRGRTIDEDFRSLKITREDLQEKGVHQSKSADGSNGGTEDIDSDDSKSDGDVTQSASGVVTANTSEHHTLSAAETITKTIPVSKPRYVEDDPNHWPCEVLIKLYVLADRFDIRELRADSMDTLIHATTTGKGLLCRLEVIRFVYQNTPPKSKLREYLAHCAAYGLAFSEEDSEWTKYPVEFLVTVMITNSRRLPDKLCRDCYEGALEYVPVSESHSDGRDSDEDLPPYETDLCFYHEHPNKSDQQACRRRRRKSSKSTI
jgi:hypothetical protein